MATIKLDARFQPYPQAAKKTETPIPEPDAEKLKSATTRVFPIYSQGNICGYYYSNKNVILPQKVALPNLGPSLTQTPPNGQIEKPLRKPIEVAQIPPQTMTPQFMATLNTLMQSNKTSTPVNSTKKPPPPPPPLPRPVHTCQKMKTGKSLVDPKTLKPLNLVSIRPAPVKFLPFMPTTFPNNIRLCVTANNNKTNGVPVFLVPVKPVSLQKIKLQKIKLPGNKDENGKILVSPETLASGKLPCDKKIEESRQNCKLKIPMWHSPVGSNVQNNNGQLTFLRSENKNSVPLSCPEPSSSKKQAFETEIEGSKQNCKLKIPMWHSPVGSNVQNNNGQSTSPGSENENSVSSSCSESSSSRKRACDTETEGSKQNCKLKKTDQTEATSDCLSEKEQSGTDVNQKDNLLSAPAPYVKTEMTEDSLSSAPAPVVKTEVTDADLNSVSYETELENDYGLVISSAFSLSEANASELGVAFENVS